MNQALDCLSWVQRSKRKLFENIWKKYYPDGDIEDDKAIVSEFQKLVDDSLEMIELHKDSLHGELSVDWIRTVFRYDLYIMMSTLFDVNIDFDSKEFPKMILVIHLSFRLLQIACTCFIWKNGSKLVSTKARYLISIFLSSKTTSILLINTEGILIYSGKGCRGGTTVFRTAFWRDDFENHESLWFKTRDKKRL